MLRFGALITLAAVGCGHAGERSDPLSNHPRPEPVTVRAGDYACRLDESGYQYPAFHCRMEPRDGRLWLEKVEGSVRVRGWVTQQGSGFAFDGELYCPWGDCTEHVASVFEGDGAGRYHGTVTSKQSGAIAIDLAYVPGHNAFVGTDESGTGFGYGGFGYAGTGYGGTGYGGATYGGAPPSH